MRLTTSRRPSRAAAATNVCRAASVKPVLPPRVPGYSVSSVFWVWIWYPSLLPGTAGIWAVVCCRTAAVVGFSTSWAMISARS